MLRHAIDGQRSPATARDEDSYQSAREGISRRSLRISEDAEVARSNSRVCQSEGQFPGGENHQLVRANAGISFISLLSHLLLLHRQARVARERERVP